MWQFKHLEFNATLLVTIFVCFNYLKKSSKYFGVDSKISIANKQYRDCRDKLVWTSLFYALAAIFAWMVNQQLLCFFLFITSTASSLYHLNKESLYFNFDNIFATSLLFIDLYSVYQAIELDDFHLIVNIVGLPLAIFLIIYCGNPADITYDEDLKIYNRCCSSKYENFHTLWHIVSSLGIASTILFYWKMEHGLEYIVVNYLDDCTYAGSFVLGSYCYYDSMRLLPVVPITSLAISIFINIIGNMLKIIPLD